MPRFSLRSWLWRVPIEKEVEEEIAFHIEMRTRELIDSGVDAKTAREIATARLGDVRRLRRTCVDLGRKRDREMHLTQRLEEFKDDVRFALRQLRSSPGFALVAALTLALGIGANSAIFALADATFLRPMPFAAPADRLVMVWERRSNGFAGLASPLEFREWNSHSRSFQAMASFATGDAAMEGSDGTPERLRQQVVSARFFDILGVNPIVGRTFQPADASAAPTVAVLNEGFWRRRFGANPTIVGNDIVIDGVSLTVVGVMPASFQIVPSITRDGVAPADPVDVWKLAGEPGPRTGFVGHYVHVIGRLKPGITVDAAQGEMAPIAAGAASQFPEGAREHGIVIDPLRRALIGPEVRLTSLLLLGVVGFVLLMCCANVANLLMSRTTGRARELAVRSALGAGRLRIAAQLVTESLVLAVLGGVMGLAIGAAIVNVAPAVIPPGLLPQAVTLTFDARVMAFCGVTAFLVGTIFGLAPAWQSTRMSLVHVIASDGRTTRASGLLRSTLVVAEVATAALVLSGAGLLLRTWISLASIDPGYRAPDAVTMVVNLPMQPPAAGNRYGSQDGLRQFYLSTLREIEREPGVRSAAWGGALPLDGLWFMQPFVVAGDPVTPGRQTFASYHIVSPAYFRTMDIPIVSGRSFTETDGRDAPAVCIVSEAFVRRFLGNRQPIGLRLAVPMMTFGGEAPPAREIVGVARQVRGRPEEIAPIAQIYVPIEQNAWYSASLIVRRDAGASAALVPSLRAAIARVDGDRAVARVRTLDQVASEATSRPRFRAVLVTSFALLALILAMVGVFGVLAYSVEQRTREFGVRVALGASAGSILRLVLSGAGRVVLAGVILGLAAAAALGGSIAAFLFGVQPLDRVTFIAVPLVLCATAVVAVAAPAWRAARVDPVVAIRES